MTIQKSLLDIGRGDLLVAGCAVAYAFHILVLGRFAGSANLGVLTVTQIATAARTQRANILVGRAGAHSVERRPLDRAAGHQPARHRAGLLRPDLGAALQQPHAHGADFLHGTGVRLGDFVSGGR